MWYLRISPKVFLGGLVILLALFLIVGFMYADQGYFLNSLIPELTGVAIELILILLVFNYWQERSKKEKLITIERRLRECLIFFLRHNFNDMPPDLKVGRFYGIDHIKNQDALEMLRLHIKNDGLNHSNVEALIKYCKRDCTTI